MNFHEANYKTKFWVLFLSFLVFLVIAQIIGTLLMIPFVGLQGLLEIANGVNLTDPNTIKALKASQIVSATGTFILPALYFARATEREPYKYLGIKVSNKFYLYILAVLFALTLLPVINYLAELNSKVSLPDSLSALENWMRASTASYEQITKAFLNDTSIIGLVVNLFIMAFLAALAEEFFFRGALQNLLVRWIKKPHLAIWITAFIFSAVHMEFFGFIPRMLLGGLLGYLFYWSGSIWIPFLVHFTNNAFAVIIQFLINKQMIDPTIETLGSDNADLLFLLTGLILSCSFFFLIKKGTANKELSKQIQ